MFVNTIKIAFRNIFRNRAASIINISGLSLGMAAAVLILLWVQNELNYDNFHSHADKIFCVDLGVGTGATRYGATPFPLAETIEKQIPGVDQTSHFVAANSFSSPVLNINEQFFKEKNLVYVDKNWFSLFHYDFIDGNVSDFNQNPYSIILTASLAKKYFSGKAAVGQTIRIDSNLFKVQAIVKDNPVNSSFQFDIFLPMEIQLKNTAMVQQGWQVYNSQTFIRIKENIPAASVTRQISKIIVQHLSISLNNNGHKDTLSASLTPLKSMHFEGSFFFKPGDKKTVTIFSVIGLLLLITASINYVNLSTANASIRSKEVSIRKIIGAGTKSLLVQFMIESLVTSFIALMATLIIVRLALPWFNMLTEKQFIFSIYASSLWEVMLVTLLLTVLLTGIYPALLLASFKPIRVLKGNNALSLKDTSLRKILVTTQFAIAIALSVSTVVILQQLHFIQGSNEGYDRSQIFSFAVPNSWVTTGYATNNATLFNTLKNELKKESAIENVTVSNDAIQNIRMSMAGIIDWEGKKQGNDPQIALLSVDPDFRQIFKLQLKEGRWYDGNNTADQHNYILTETTVATLGLKKPYVGQYFSVMRDTGRIIGIVKDFHFRNYHSKIEAAVLLSRADMQGTFFVQSAATKMNLALAKATATCKKFFPNRPFEFKFMDAEFEQMYRADRKTAALVSAFSGIAIFISCLGLFGLVSLMAAQRTKEIGIRKILGATVTNIVALLSKDFVRLVVLAIIIASPVAWWAMTRWLESFAYRIELRWWMFAVAGAAAVLLALVTVSIQSIKAAIANPAQSLRTQ